MTWPTFGTGRIRRPALLWLGIALVAGLFLLRQHYRLAMVVGESMLPTLHPGELLLVDRRAYTHSTPQRGDVILARYHSDIIVKRIVGLPGEELELRQGILYVDGLAADEHHGIKKGALDVAKGKLGDDDFATLGDNRAIPAAIAVHPILSRAEILGKVIGSWSSHTL